MTIVDAATDSPTACDSKPVPRVVEFITVKRNIALAGRSYGHWWVEFDNDESYGWWPSHSVRLDQLFRGVPGVLNGIGLHPDAMATRDPNHGLPGDFEFHPVLVKDNTDEELRDNIRCFAASFEGGWRWSTRQTMNCRMFQLAMFDAVGLVDGTGNYHTRGSGCPALAPIRRTVGRLTGRRRWPFNLPQPGQRVALWTRRAAEE